MLAGSKLRETEARLLRFDIESCSDVSMRGDNLR
jgi:hypothetical protein